VCEENLAATARSKELDAQDRAAEDRPWVNVSAATPVMDEHRGSLGTRKHETLHHGPIDGGGRIANHDLQPCVLADKRLYGLDRLVLPASGPVEHRHGRKC
jgi:hypothetical protein